MSQDIKTKELEKKAQAYTGDGLIDIMLGLVVCFAGINMLFDLTAFSAVWIILLIPVTRNLKRSITLPRIDQVAFDPRPGTQYRKLFVILTMLGLLAFMVVVGLIFLRLPEVIPPGLSSVLDAQPPIYAISMVLVFFLLCLILIARGFGAKHFLAYAALVVVFAISSIWVLIEFPYYMIVFGTIALVYGIVSLFQFMRKYPKLEQATQT